MSSETERLQKTNVIAIVMGVTVFVMVTIAVWASMTSVEKRTVVEGEDGKTSTRVERIDSVTCESDTVKYPFFEYDNASRRDLKIVVSMGDMGLRTVDLQYTLYYDDAEMVVKSEAENHAAMNIRFYEKGLGSDAAGATYAKLGDVLRLSLHQTGDRLLPAESEFLLIDGIKEFDKASVAQHFEKLGMSCTTSE